MRDPCTIALELDKQLMALHNNVADNIVNRDELQDNLINQILDDMDIKTMMALLYDMMDESYDKYSVNELIQEAEEYYPHLLED